jgi:phosphoglycerol transferase MdoB-like AlkP superfamily enzyme
MSRLYYETAPAVNVPESGPVNGSGSNNNDIMDYLNKVSKLIPAEILAGYLTMFGLVDSIKKAAMQHVLMWVVFAAGLILTPIYLNLAADPGKPKRNHLIVSTIAFVVWAYVTTGKALSNSLAADSYDPAVASIILILFSLISGKIKMDK